MQYLLNQLGILAFLSENNRQIKYVSDMYKSVYSYEENKKYTYFANLKNQRILKKTTYNINLLAKNDLPNMIYSVRYLK